MSVVSECWARMKAKKEIARWRRRGCPAPPPHAHKQDILREYARQYGLRILVETGTYHGDMVAAMKRDFEKVISIELSPVLYAKARERFKGDRNVALLMGDSSREIGKVVTQLRQPALFWLDGHYSAGETACGEKETPILEELEHILIAENLGHVIIIDDARCFGSEPSYPTVEEVKSFVLERRARVEIFVKDDSIRIVPQGKP